MDSRASIDKALQVDISTAQLRQFLLQRLFREPSEPDLWRWKINWSSIKQHIDKIKDFPRLDCDSVLHGASTKSWKVNTPVLFISGELSDYVGENGKDAINLHFEKPQFKVLNGANHWLHAEQPKPFSDAVLKFFGI